MINYDYELCLCDFYTIPISSALAFIEFSEADAKANLIAAADAELRQQKADIERQRMEDELVRAAADAADIEGDEEGTGDDSDDDDDDEGDDDDDEGEDDDDEDEEESSEEEEEEDSSSSGEKMIRKTRSRGNVKIDLWSLEDGD